MAYGYKLNRVAVAAGASSQLLMPDSRRLGIIFNTVSGVAVFYSIRPVESVLDDIWFSKGFDDPLFLTYRDWGDLIRDEWHCTISGGMATVTAVEVWRA